MRHEWWIIALALLALSGCQATAPVAAGAADAQPVPRLIPLKGVGVVVCLSPEYEQGEKWRAACAPVGPFRPCIETRTTLDCSQAQGRPARRID